MTNAEINHYLDMGWRDAEALYDWNPYLSGEARHWYRLGRFAAAEAHADAIASASDIEPTFGRYGIVKGGVLE